MDEQRARDGDRNAAIKLVDSAWAVGEIIEADRDKRIEQLRMAQTLAEIQMLTHDIQSSAPEPLAPESLAPEPVAPAQPEPSYPPVDYGPPTPTADPPYATLDQVTAMSPRKVSKSVLLIPLAVVLVIAVASIGGIIALVGSIGDGIDGVDVGSVGEEPDVLSVDGYADLLAAVEEETGSTIAFSAVLYPRYAVVELPVDTTTQREEYWYWDGKDLTRNDMKSTSSFERTDLSRIDAAVIVDLVEQVRKNVEDPTSYYAIVRAPDDDRAVVGVYASNDYSESEYLGARRDGTITYDSTEH